MKNIPILVSDRGHQPTRNNILKMFDATSLGALENLSDRQRASIRGIACLFDTLGKTQFDMLTNLEIVASFGVGYDQIDAAAAAERGIMVTHTPGVLDDEVADTTIGLLLSTIREIPGAEAYLRDGRWAADGPYPLSKLTLRGRRVGIFGMGRIGHAIARRLEGFGVEIAYHNRSVIAQCGYQYFGSLVELAENVDTLINVAPATAQTRNTVDAAIFKALGHTGVFINVGRGATVVQEDLAVALHHGTIAAAGLDVYADEPDVPASLLAAPNTVLLPHIASASEHTRAAMGQLVIENLISWFDKGVPVSSVPETRHLPQKTAAI
ncbi:MAG: 2-hydroxyacid dehydrogenase [Pseudomonadota bacterium]